MYTEGKRWVLNSTLFADDTVLIAEAERDFPQFGQCFCWCIQKEKAESTCQQK